MIFSAALDLAQLARARGKVAMELKRRDVFHKLNNLNGLEIEGWAAGVGS